MMIKKMIKKNQEGQDNDNLYRKLIEDELSDSDLE